MMSLMTRMDLCRYDIKCVIALVCWLWRSFSLFAKTHQMFVPLFAVIHLVLEDSVGIIYEWSKCI
jgi:hypothetical protein